MCRVVSVLAVVTVLPAVAGSADLSKHVGQKVSITGSLSDGSMGTMRHDLSTLTIKTLRVIGKSCS